MEFVIYLYLTVTTMCVGIFSLLMIVEIADGYAREARKFARLAAGSLIWPVALPYLIYYYGWANKP